jgi:hypothetical protein
LATTDRSDDTSALASTSSGSATTRLSGVGAVKVLVTRYSATSSSQRRASNLRSTTTRPPSAWVSEAQASGPEW